MFIFRDCLFIFNIVRFRYPWYFYTLPLAVLFFLPQNPLDPDHHGNRFVYFYFYLFNPPSTPGAPYAHPRSPLYFIFRWRHFFCNLPLYFSPATLRLRRTLSVPFFTNLNPYYFYSCTAAKFFVMSRFFSHDPITLFHLVHPFDPVS